MANIKNPGAYFGTIVRNMDKNGFRSNDNFFGHISSVGGEADVLRKLVNSRQPYENRTDSIEKHLFESDTQNWLLFMENEQLHKALSALPETDIDFLLGLTAFGFNQTEYAAAIGVSRQWISKRFLRLRKIILKMW